MVKFTIKRGKVVSTSVQQHRFLHARALDHTHIEDGKRKRETFTTSERKEALKRARALGFTDSMMPSGVKSMEKMK